MVNRYLSFVLLAFLITLVLPVCGEESGGTAGKGAGDLWGEVKKTPQAIWKGGKEMVEAATKGGGEAWEATKEGGSAAWESTKERAGQLRKGVSDALSGE